MMLCVIGKSDNKSILRSADALANFNRYTFLGTPRITEIMIDEIIGAVLDNLIHFEYSEQISDLPIVPRLIIHILTFIVVALTGTVIYHIVFAFIPRQAELVGYFIMLSLLIPLYFYYDSMGKFIGNSVRSLICKYTSY